MLKPVFSERRFADAPTVKFLKLTVGQKLSHRRLTVAIFWVFTRGVVMVVNGEQKRKFFESCTKRQPQKLQRQYSNVSLSADVDLKVFVKTLVETMTEPIPLKLLYI